MNNNKMNPKESSLSSILSSSSSLSSPPFEEPTTPFPKSTSSTVTASPPYLFDEETQHVDQGALAHEPGPKPSREALHPLANWVNTAMASDNMEKLFEENLNGEKNLLSYLCDDGSAPEELCRNWSNPCDEKPRKNFLKRTSSLLCIKEIWALDTRLVREEFLGGRASDLKKRKHPPPEDSQDSM